MTKYLSMGQEVLAWMPYEMLPGEEPRIIKGKIVGYRFPNDTGFYEIETKAGTFWRTEDEIYRTLEEIRENLHLMVIL